MADGRVYALVGIEEILGNGLRAHALVTSRIGDLGIAHCGFLVEYLTLLPDVKWENVAVEQRCPHCAEDV